MDCGAEWGVFRVFMLEGTRLLFECARPSCFRRGQDAARTATLCSQTGRGSGLFSSPCHLTRYGYVHVYE